MIFSGQRCNALRQDKTDNSDGMDLSLCRFDKINNKEIKLTFAGAKRNIYIIDGYINEDTLDYLNISKKASIRIITNNIYGNFKREYKRFRKEYDI